MDSLRRSRSKRRYLVNSEIKIDIFVDFVVFKVTNLGYG